MTQEKGFNGSSTSTVAFDNKLLVRLYIYVYNYVLYITYICYIEI